MKVDYHIHTTDSIDARNTVDECCQAAVNNGLTEICFTNHHEWESVENKSFDFALSDEKWINHISAIKSARIKYPRLKIKFGVELGYYENKEEYLRELTKKYPFDFVLGSIHLVDNIQMGYHEQLSVSEEKKIELWKKYFTLVAKASKTKIFDCISHFDFPKRRLGPIKIAQCKNEMQKAINDMEKNGTGFELNMSGYFLTTKEQFPSIEILELLKNIPNVTVGSDSHHAEHIGRGFEEGISILQKAGFKSITTFEKRKPKMINIYDIKN